MAALVAREQLVNDSIRYETTYLGRLEGYLQGSGDSHQPSGNGASRELSFKLAAVVRQLSRALSLAPFYLTQYRHLQRLRRAKPDATELIVALASNRIPLHEGIQPRRNLELLLQPLGGHGAGRLAQKVAEADCILAVDAVPRSSYWKHRRQCWNDGIFIVDSGFLFFLLLVSAIRAPDHLRSILDCFQRRRTISPERRPSVSMTLLGALMSSTADALMRGSKNCEAILLTSHSLVTELCRAALIENEACALIVEVMHGIGSIDAEAFSASVLAAGQPFGS
jgi:hypothetical protein